MEIQTLKNQIEKSYPSEEFVTYSKEGYKLLASIPNLPYDTEEIIQTYMEMTIEELEVYFDIKPKNLFVFEMFNGYYYTRIPDNLDNNKEIEIFMFKQKGGYKAMVKFN